VASAGRLREAPQVAVFGAGRHDGPPARDLLGDEVAGHARDPGVGRLGDVEDAEHAAASSH
jgi:hypothetical protein